MSRRFNTRRSSLALAAMAGVSLLAVQAHAAPSVATAKPATTPASTKTSSKSSPTKTTTPPVTTPAASGVYNGTAPQPVIQRDFAKALGHALHRPAVMAMPAPGRSASRPT